MKRLLTAAIALSLLTGTAAMAQPDHRDDRGAQSQGRDDQKGNDRSQEVHQRNDARQAQQHWARGQRMPSTYYRDSSRYVDYRAYHLSAPRRGYRWVRTDDNNYAMVAIATGLIASIAAANH
ncbi:RcnB family protein [Phenylobacterium sp.]|jgi:Ni/Co efflux regulator RcnB|uniref:RcnB family protein n=1 Tax=Phenylobacterium sp. TaxID=1871053 RepID=UPI002E328A19|nr:RcnB family protein [Phenylobacterium sp.]HEX3364302.1 RcnB family protein [Phenylobacterium sp.]